MTSANSFLHAAPGLRSPREHVEEALANDALPEEVKQSFLAGKPLKYPTPYGDGYMSIRYLEDLKQFELDFDKKINVRIMAKRNLPYRS